MASDLEGRPSYYAFSGNKRIAPRLRDITATGADVIVHAVSITATFSNTIAKRILEVAGESAGPAIKREVQRHTPIAPGLVVVTHAGDIPSTRYLFHAMVSPSAKRYRADSEQIFEAVRRCVRLADLLGQETMAFPALGTGGGRASPVKAIRRMVSVFLGLLPACEHLQEIVFATTSAESFALFNNRVLADIALAEREQELKSALPSLPPSLYGEVGKLLLRMEATREAGGNAQVLLEQAEGFVEVASELGQRVPREGDLADTVQLIIATGGSIVNNVKQQIGA
jgi:O-acetyl-ADP-ribose deacetylase (regulator of RNase III)